MRVIAGSLGGRSFDSPHSFKTHPMSDRMRGALFNILGDIEGLRCLDAFAGSGALSFEAASRGAAKVIAIDSDRSAQKTVQTNIAALRLQRQVTLVAASANAWLTTNPDAYFDIVLCDPPYTDLQPSLLQRLAEHVQSDGILVLSWPAQTEPPIFKHMQQVDHRKYADATLVFYRRIR